MSNLDPRPEAAAAGGTSTVALAPVAELMPGREVVLGGTRGLPVTRTLPNAQRRMIGPWCFVDHYRSEDVANGPGMRVPPHPHAGLQTVTWLLDGAVRHRDSLGSDQLITPGQLNLMTAGHGIAHSEDSEDSPAAGPPSLHGVQLWVALPEADRHGRRSFEHHPDLPRVRLDDADTTVTVLVGALDLPGATSPATTYSPVVGAQVAFGGPGASGAGAGGEPVTLPLQAGYEHAALSLSGRVEVEGVALAPGSLLYLGCGRAQVRLSGPAGARLLLLGGAPFEERIVMWWNFIGRSHDEIAAMREQWMAGDDRFGHVPGGQPLPAPAMPTTTLLPRGRTR